MTNHQFKLVEKVVQLMRFERALLAGSTTQEIATAVGVSTRQVARYMQLYAALSSEVYGGKRGKIQTDFVRGQQHAATFRIKAAQRIFA